MKLENWKIHKYVEMRHATEQPMGQNEELEREIKKYLETNENGNIRYQNLWDAAKSILTGKLRKLNTYLKKQEKSQINNLTLQFKELKKKNKRGPKLGEGKK